MDSSEKLAKAIRGLTIAIWCWIGFQALLYGSSYFGFWRAASQMSSDETTWKRESTTSVAEEETDYDKDFFARPMRDKIRLSTAILVVEMKEVGGLHRAIVQEILKLKPGVRLYYKVGDDFDDLNHFPGKDCDECTAAQHSLVFMQGNPAAMRFSTTFEGDRISSLGGMTIDELRKLAQESLGTPP